MTIRRRLFSSFSAILLLGLNLIVYFWSDLRRVEREQFFDRDRLQQSQALVSSVHVDTGMRATASVPIIVP